MQKARENKVFKEQKKQQRDKKGKKATYLPRLVELKQFHGRRKPPFQMARHHQPLPGPSPHHPRSF